MSDIPHASGGPRMIRRRRAAIYTALVAALVSGGGLVGSTFVQSPSQAAADTRAPRASLITAPVTRQILRSTVVMRGNFTDGKTLSVTPTKAEATANNAGAASLIISGVFVKPGDHVKAAEPLVEFSGRPVFALPGAIPAYRDLVPGESGKDVTQLQAALASIGYDTQPDAAGTFGKGTQRALKNLYKSMGYPPPVADPSSVTAVASAQQKVDQLKAALTAADSTSTASASAADPSSVNSQTSPSGGPTEPATQNGLSMDPGTLEQQLTQAEQALAQAQDLEGPILPASEVVFVPSLPARVVSVPVAVGDQVKGPVITLADGGLQLVGMLDPTQAALVKTGLRAQVVSEDLGLQATGSVTSIGQLTTPTNTSDAQNGSNGDNSSTTEQNNGAAYLPVTIKPNGSWDSRLADQNVRITITAAATAEPVLAVPEAAISAGADTRTSVTVLDASGAQRPVPVQTGVSADGMVAVTPLKGYRLAPGDRVVVGQ